MLTCRARPTWSRALRGIQWASTSADEAAQAPGSGATQQHESRQIACLKDVRAVLRLQGAQLLTFLQGLVTNDVRPLANGGGPVHASVLSPKGKFLHDLFLYSVKGDPDALLVDVDAAGVSRTMDLLNRYKLRRPIQIQDVSKEQQVWVAFGGPSSSPPPEGWHPDPRLPDLGYRTILPVDEQPSTSGGESISTERMFRRWRYTHGVAEGEAEMPTEKAFPLDYGIDALHGMSYDKGCYIGQERSSFTHFRGVVRRRAMPVHIQPPTDLPAGVQLCSVASGAKEGTLLAAAGDVGLAHLRVKEVLAGMAGGDALQPQGGAAGVVVTPFRPRWWRPEWGHEEEEGQAGGAAAPQAP